jgi:hypothetical protein
MGDVEKVHRVRPLAVLAVVAVVQAVGGCGFGSDEPPPTPAGFQRHRADAYTVAYPAGWQIRDGKDERGRPYTEINGPVTPEGAYVGQVRVGRWNRYPGRLEDQLTQFRALAMASGYTIQSDRRVSIDGAGQAHRFEVAYRRTTGTGATVRLKMTDTFVLTQNKLLLEFIVRSPEGGAASARLPEILDSFDVTGD